MADEKAAILEADDRRRKAIVANDAKALSETLTDDYIHIHTSGRVDTKEQYLTPMREGKSNYTNSDRHDATVLINGDTAWMYGRQTVAFDRPGNKRTIENRYLAVFRKTPGGWKMAVINGTPLA
jgi:ketosteroid isomerase-like protein